MQPIRWGILALCVPALFAQASRPEFEVASVKPAPQITAGPTVNIGIRIDGAQFSCTSYSLKDYVRFAYNMQPYGVIAPDWTAQERYEITARIPDGSMGKVREMVQTLLEDRFKLKVHHEQREFPVYALVVGKGPLKMKEVEADAGPVTSVTVTAQGGPNGVHVDLGGGAYFGFSNNKFEAKKLPMDRFAQSVSVFTDRPVVDMTGLKGRYDFELDVSEEDYRSMLIRSAVNNGVNLPPQALQFAGNSNASLFAAVQQLGLKLEPRKAPLDVLVVDSAEKTPTAN